MPTLPMEGIRIIDLSMYWAGPMAGRLLADFGAEVIKIESLRYIDPWRGPVVRNPNDVRRYPKGITLERPYNCSAGFNLQNRNKYSATLDLTTPQGKEIFKDNPHPEKSGLFLYLNTNKKGITLNLKSEAGVKIFKELVKDTDILVENFSPRVMPGLGLDYETLEKINPRLVMTSISNFGQTGPYRDYKATDIVEDAMGGWMTIVGHPEREPLKPGGYQAQFVSGLFSAVGTMTAFYGQEMTGIGQHVDISIMDAVVYIQMNITQYYSYNETIHKRFGNRLTAPGSVLPCKDGYILSKAVTGRQWETFCQWMGMPELIEDPRFITNVDRLQNADELDAYQIPFLLEHEGEELYREAQKRRLPCSVTVNTKQLLESPHLNARGYFVEVDHPATGKLRYPGAQLKMGDLPYQLKRAPLLGEHNEEVYCKRLGYTDSDLITLRKQGII